MEQFTAAALLLLEEIDTAARRAVENLGLSQMRNIIGDIDAYRSGKVKSLTGLALNISSNLTDAENRVITADEIRDLCRSKEYDRLEQLSDHIIQCRELHDRWIRLIVDRRMYKE